MNAPDPHIRSAITQVAANWYAAHRAGPLPEADRAAFLAWIKASPVHIEEYLGVAALERTLAVAGDDPPLSVQALVEMARAADDGVVDIGGPSIRYQPVSLPPRQRFLPGIAAAVIASVAAAGVLWWVVREGRGPAPAVATYRTAHGQQGIWPLSDGSTLHVNTDTQVTVRFSATERLLEVEHGQVAVKVAHDRGRTFRVHAGSTDAVAVGTDFDVRRTADATVVTVATGQVAVSVGPFVPPRAAAGLPSGMRVGAGQQVTVVAGVLPPAPQSTDLREATAWLERKIVFDQQPLAAVAAEFNRYNDIPFTIDDPTLRRLRISGAFDAADTESFAAFLQSLDGVRVERLPTGFKVLNSRDKRGSDTRNI